jgi:hypothetical protein
VAYIHGVWGNSYRVHVSRDRVSVEGQKGRPPGVISSLNYVNFHSYLEIFYPILVDIKAYRWTTHATLYQDNPLQAIGRSGNCFLNS